MNSSRTDGKAAAEGVTHPLSEVQNSGTLEPAEREVTLETFGNKVVRLKVIR